MVNFFKKVAKSIHEREEPNNAPLFGGDKKQGEQRFVASSSSEDAVDKKFNGLNSMLKQKKEALFTNQVMADKYWKLKDQYRYNMSEDEIQNMAGQLDANEMRDVRNRVDDDIRRLKIATKDASEFKRYFFDDLVPIMQENNDALLREQRFNPADRKSALEGTKKQWKETTSLTIKLLLSNINDPSAGFLTRWISKAYANATATWGLNHAGLQIGPYLFDWTTSEIIIPRIFKAKKIVLLIPINENCVVPKSDDVLYRISSFVVNWNNNYKYHQRNNSERNRTGNCQYFVECMLSELGIKPSWQKNGPIERYIAHIKDSSISGDDLKVWDKDGKEIIFQNHDDLRNYYEANVKLMADHRIRQEMQDVLKSVERCMMFRYWATNDKKYAVEYPIFTKKFKQQQQKARSKLYRGEDDADESDTEPENTGDDDEPQVTGQLDFSRLRRN